MTETEFENEVRRLTIEMQESIKIDSDQDFEVVIEEWSRKVRELRERYLT